MAKYTKKWQNDFEKRYSQTMKDLQSLEKEYKEMCDSNPDIYVSVYPKNDSAVLGECNAWGLYHLKENESTENTNEHISLVLYTKIGNFEFNFFSFDQIINFRNEVIEVCDKFARPVESETKKIVDECQEYSDVSDEEWEQMEDKEWTVRVTRPCTQSWTLTVMAKNSCEAEKKARMGEPEEDVRHDENDDFDNYGPEDFECID